MKFFNKQRMNSLSFKKIRKYIVYAIGEIILVVLGILIAVSINNANEESKNQKNLQLIAEQTKEKFKNDLSQIQNLKLDLELTKELFDNYLYPADNLSDQKIKNSINQAPYLVTVGLDFLVFDSSIASLDRVNLKNDSLSISLSNINKFYKDASATLKIQENFIAAALVENMEYIKNNYAWYDKIALFKGTFTKEEYAYFKTTDYRNRVVHMYSLYIESYYNTLEYLEAMIRELSASLELHMK